MADFHSPFNNAQRRNIPVSKVDDIIDFYNDDEDLKATDFSYQSNNSLKDKDEIMLLIEKSYDYYKNNYQGIKSSRYLTTEILLKAPEDYFDKYQYYVKKATSAIREEISNNDTISAIFKDAVRNPINEAYQESAFQNVRGFTEAFLEDNNKFLDKNGNSLEKMILDKEKKLLRALIINELLGLGVIDPLWRDKNVTEIMCNGPYDIQIEMSGELYKVKSCKFRDSSHLMDRIEKLYSAINKQVSLTTPLVKGRLPDKSRMFTVHDSVAPDGPNISIRKHPASFWTPEAIISKGSATEEIMTFIGNYIYKGASVLVNGGTHSLKSS